MDEVKHFPLNHEETAKIQNLISEISNDPDILGLIRYGSSTKTTQYQDVDLCIVAKSKAISPGNN